MCQSHNLNEAREFFSKWKHLTLVRQINLNPLEVETSNSLRQFSSIMYLNKITNKIISNQTKKFC